MPNLITRIRQFLRAAFTKINSADLAIINQYLDQSEQRLFFGMDPAIQKHCVNTALTVVNMPPAQTGGSHSLLIRAALLHDIGKSRDTINLLDRVCYVLVKKVSRQWVKRLAAAGSGSTWARFRNAFYVHLHHPELGAILAEKAGLEEDLVYLLRHHHDTAQTAHSRDLAILIKADELN